MSRIRYALALPALLLALAVARPADTDGKHYALLVGVNKYDHDKLSDLRYAEADALDTADVLQAHGYEVVLLVGNIGRAEAARRPKLAGIKVQPPTLANIQARLAELVNRCTKRDLLLVGLAGHGFQFDGTRDAFFCPQDAKPLSDRADTLLSLTKVYEQLDRSGAGVKLMLVDACRNDPLAGRGRGVNGNSAPPPPAGVAALFSCSAGETALESDKLRHGIFFHRVLTGLGGEAKNGRGEVTWDGLQAYVRHEVSDDAAKLTNGVEQQTPSLNAGELRGRPPVLLAVKDAGPKAEADPGRVQPKPADGKTVTLDLGGGVTMEFVRIPAGKFPMGSPRDEEGRFDDEGPRHEVTIGKAFYLGKYHVTRGQFRRFVRDADYATEAESSGEGSGGLKADGSGFEQRKEYKWNNVGFEQTDEHPVVDVSWNDAQKFCAWLSRKSGKAVSLPTEAQWEYACRAGTTTAYFTGESPASLEGYANVAGQELAGKAVAKGWTLFGFRDGYEFTSPVGRFKPNAFGLYDMTGNAWQWRQDRYGEKYYNESINVDPKGPSEGERRVLRGGSWYIEPRCCRCACRDDSVAANRNDAVGVRVCCRLDFRTPDGKPGTGGP